ncbi:hypothetical protein BU16DRAFT_305461 [Lophium mytilinum]|uniref:Uncharacterized protein n=1 Tax=Lophium mytilinum TaxID=390894 RepID=A0A6A6R2L1_9PEZI|nr:hypothetical protein BU16DRAFT_305461 [Lophium mytilinum]
MCQTYYTVKRSRSTTDSTKESGNGQETNPSDTNTNQPPRDDSNETSSTKSSRAVKRTLSSSNPDATTSGTSKKIKTDENTPAASASSNDLLGPSHDENSTPSTPNNPTPPATATDAVQPATASPTPPPQTRRSTVPMKEDKLHSAKSSPASNEQSQISQEESKAAIASRDGSPASSKHGSDTTVRMIPRKPVPSPDTQVPRIALPHFTPFPEGDSRDDPAESSIPATRETFPMRVASVGNVGSSELGQDDDAKGDKEREGEGQEHQSQTSSPTSAKTAYKNGESKTDGRDGDTL